MSYVTAVKTGVALVDGVPQEVLSGVTVWSRSCPELRDPTVAALFGLADCRFVGGRTVTRSRPTAATSTAAPWRLPDSRPTPRSTRTRGTPRLLKGPPQHTVALAGSARDSIFEEFDALTRGRDVGRLAVRANEPRLA